MLVTDLLEGARFEEVKRRDDATRDRFGEIVFRFYFGLVKYLGRVSGDPHPGNYLLLADGRVGFLDFGLMRVLDPGYLEGEQAVAAAVEAGDADAVHASLSALGYLPDPASFDPEALLEQVSAMGAWYLEPGERRFTPAYVAELIDSTSGPRSPWFEQMRLQTIPPQALLLRRMEGLVFATLGEVRAAADWNAIAREFYLDAPPTTRARGGRGRVLGAPLGGGLSGEPRAHHPHRLRRLVHQQVAPAELAPPPRRACPSPRTGPGTGRPAAWRPAPCGARSPPASASDSRSSRPRWGRRSCATTRPRGACRARAAPA